MMLGLALLPGYSNKEIPSLPRYLAKKLTGRPPAIKFLGTSIIVESKGGIIDALGPGFAFTVRQDSGAYSADSPDPLNSFGAVSGALMTNSGGKDGILANQLDKTLANPLLWDACYIGAPVNNRPTNKANVIAHVAALVDAGNRLEAVGIWPIFESYTAGDSSSPMYDLGVSRAMAIVCEARGWGFVDTRYATINPANGKHNTTYTRDTIHPNKLGRQRIGSEIARVLQGQLCYSSPFLAMALTDSFTVTGESWANLLTNGSFVDGAGAASTSGWTLDNIGGTPTVALAAGTETDAVVGGVVSIPRSSTSGAAGIRQDTPASTGAAITAGDEIIVCMRQFGDTRSGHAQTDMAVQPTPSFSAAIAWSYQTDVFADPRTGIVRVQTTTPAADTRFRVTIRNSPNAAGSTGVIKVAQVSLCNKTRIINDLGLAAHMA